MEVFDPNTGNIRSNDTAGITTSRVDTDYDEESFFVRGAPISSAPTSPTRARRPPLSADIDEGAWATLYSDTSPPFERPESRRIAVKVINHFGDEVMKVFGFSTMNFLIADTFTASFNRLSGLDQKAVKASVFDFQMDPAGNGLQLHRIDNSKDPISDKHGCNHDVRLIVHKTGESLLVAYVGHHDDAYAWAERRRIEAHPRTGAVQIVEVRERVEEVAPPATFDFVFPEPAKGKEKETAPPALFSSLDDDALLSIGVPTDWLADVRAATEDGYFALTAHLPAEASEALLEFATTGRLLRPLRFRLSPTPSPIPMRCGGSG